MVFSIPSVMSDLSTFQIFLECALVLLVVFTSFALSRKKQAISDDELPLRDSASKNKWGVRLFAICGQSVSQQNGALNVHLREYFLKVSSPKDYAIFAGTPQEKNVFFDGYKPYREFKCGDVTLTLYNLHGRTVCTLKEHHSRKSIHNCVEVLWSLIILESLCMTAWTSVHAVMYDSSQCVRTGRILSLENAHYGKLIKENTAQFREGAPSQQCEENKRRLSSYWTKNGCDIKALLKEVTESVSLLMTESCFYTMIEIFTNVSQCKHIGCSDKQNVEINLVWKWGAGYNYGDLCDLLPDEFTMDGARQRGSSDS